MATRSIVTSQPDVACDVCGRRLLRGEQPDRFLAGGEERTVCELCAPRAAQEGWLRASEREALGPRPPRTRKGVSLLDRLRQLREPAPREGSSRTSARRRLDVYDEDAALGGYEGELYLGSVVAEPHGAAESAAAPAGSVGSVRDPAERDAVPAERRPAPVSAGATPAPGLAEAVRIFNAGEQPRRVAGVARSLGAPTVTALPVGDPANGRVAIVVAWELCWYRYEVDPADELAGAQPVAKGMELDQLRAEERAGNAVADDHGELRLVA